MDLEYMAYLLIGVLFGGLLMISVFADKKEVLQKPIEQPSVTCEVYLHASDKEVHKYVGEVRK